MKQRIAVLVIDGQGDFCDDFPGATLPVTGAGEDMKRLGGWITRYASMIASLHATLDCHDLFHIANTTFYIDGATGAQVAPFTAITSADFRAGKYRLVPQLAFLYTRVLAYMEALESTGRYVLITWPPHCQVGEPGHNLHPALITAFRAWKEQWARPVNFVAKGNNFMTEHYSAVRAEVPDPSDPSTSINMGLIRVLQDHDQVILAGEALSHCVLQTGDDIISQFGAGNADKIAILTDCSSPVTGFEPQAKDFLARASAQGVRLITTTTPLH